MKIILIIASSLLMLNSCKEDKPTDKIAENFNIQNSKNKYTTKREPQKENTFNWDSIPISHADLGQFPYFNPPKGFETYGEENLDFSKLIFYVNNETQSFEGKVFKASFQTKRDEKLNRPEWNEVLFDKSYDDFIRSKGGVVVFDGKIPNDTLIVIGGDNVGKYIVGDVYNQSIKIYAIHQLKKRVLIQLESSVAGGSIGVLAIEDFEQTITTITSETIKKELDEVGHIALYINFETGKSRIKPDSYQLISEIAKMLQSQPELKITIEGHTDDVGGENDNQKLSENRAKSVELAITDEGIDTLRLKSIGYGESKPIAENTTEEGRAKNRRVEIRKQ
jgi:outer membrane protein OmpA-like peptidoglycan-associated protein